MHVLVNPYPAEVMLLCSGAAAEMQCPLVTVLATTTAKLPVSSKKYGPCCYSLTTTPASILL